MSFCCFFCLKLQQICFKFFSFYNFRFAKPQVYRQIHFLPFKMFKSSPFSKLICCSCCMEFSTTTLSSSWMLRSKISVDGKAIVGGGLGKSLWWKFNLVFKLGGDDGDRECNELSDTSMSEASSTSKLFSTCSASGEPTFWSYSGECERLRLFFDKFNTGLSFVGDAFRELLCLSFSSWFSSSFSFRNLNTKWERKVPFMTKK